MLKKTIKYTDYDGNEREEDFYFNLSQAELVEMEFSAVGGFTQMVKRIIASQDAPKIMSIFKDLILKTYGEKSPDGKRFIKSKELSEAFAQTEAYVNLFMELSSDAEAGAAFVNGVVPKEMVDKTAANLEVVK